MNKTLVYVLGSVCLLETVGLVLLWPRAHRLVFTQNQDGITQTVLMAQPGEKVIVRTSEPTFSVVVWEKGAESHVAVERSWDNERHYAIGLWSDQTHQIIQGVYSRYLNGQMISTQAFDDDGMPSERVTRNSLGSSGATKFFKRSSLNWDEIPRQTWYADKR